MKPAIVESIQGLPPLPRTLVSMEQVCADPASSVADLIRTIEHDPMIVANLLKAANSPLYMFGEEIKSVSQAVALFGITMTRSIALGHAVRKLLNVDMEPYGITSERFAEISSLQAALMRLWYEPINPEKAEKLFLAAFLQETGKILIASEIIQENLTYNFKADIELTHHIAQVEQTYVEETTATVTAAIFEHWQFEKEFVEMIRFSDDYRNAPASVAEYATALNIVKTILPVNAPFEEHAITQGLRKAYDAGYDHELLEDAVDAMLEKNLI